VPQLHTN